MAKTRKNVRPVRTDPTKSLTLRRSMAGEVKRSFAILKGAIVRLVLHEDVFGLRSPYTGNAFCPTGPGGGSDNSCGPSGSKSGEEDHELKVGGKLDREQVIQHIMKVNPPEQVAKGVMTAEEWAHTYLSNEPGGYVVMDVDPRVLNAPTVLGDPGKAEGFKSRSADDAPPVVVDSNEKIQARLGGSKIDQAYGLQPHTLVDGKHRTAAAVARGDKKIMAVVPVRKAKELLRESHSLELLEFAHEFAAKKGHTILSTSMTGHGPQVTAKTKEGYDRLWGPSDLEKIAHNTGHKFKFVDSETRNSAQTGNAFCSTGQGGGVDPSCGKGEGHGGGEKHVKTKYQGHDVTLAVQPDGNAKIVHGPEHLIGKTLQKKAPSPAPAAPPPPPPVPDKSPAGDHSSSEKETRHLTSDGPPKTAEEAEQQFASRFKTRLGRGKMSDQEYLNTATAMLGEYQRLTDSYPVIAKTVAARPGRMYSLKLGEDFSGETGSAKGASSAYKFSEGIRLGKIPLSDHHEPNIGGHAVDGGHDLRAQFRHELGHEVYDGLPRGKKSSWDKVAQPHLGTNHVSRYGGTNPTELFCESLSAYTSPKYKRGSLPPDVEKWMDQNVGHSLKHHSANGLYLSILNTAGRVLGLPVLSNAFCPTGQGGGVDASCPRGGLKAALTEHAGATGRGKELLNIGLYNGGYDPDDPPKEAPSQRALAGGLVTAWLGGTRKGYSPAEMAPVETALHHVGASQIGKRGEVVTFSGAHHKADTPVGIGAKVRIVHPGWGIHEKEGRFFQLHPAHVEVVTTRNAFCPTGTGGGVDASCSPGGSGRDELVSKHVGDSRSLTPSERADLAGHAEKSTTSRAHLQRVVSDDPRHGVGDVVHLGPTSFTDVKLTEGRGAEHIAVKYSDSAAYVVDKPSRGLDVDYKKVKTPHFSAAGERETILAGRYRVKKAENVEHPARTGNLRVYHLEEVGGVSNAYRRVVHNTRFAFETSAGKVKRFREWLKGQVDRTIDSPSDKSLWEQYIGQGYKKGVKSGHLQSLKLTGAPEGVVPPARDKGGLLTGPTPLDYHKAARDQYLQRAFSKQATVDKVKLLAGRTFSEMEDVSTRMATKMSRRLADGLVKGHTPEQIARSLVDEVDIAKRRALTIAHTELIRAHAEGQLDALEDLGHEFVTPAVEWDTAHDGKVCDLCAPLEGVVLSIDEARGMLPRHPWCRCAWSIAGEGSAETKRTGKASIDRAIKKSLAEGGQTKDDWSPGRSISKYRPV